MMRKNLTTGETIDFGKIPKDCLSLLKKSYVAYNIEPTSTLTGVKIDDDSEDVFLFVDGIHCLESINDVPFFVIIVEF